MNLPAGTTLLKFVLAAAVGSGGTMGIAAATQSGPVSTAHAGPANLYTGNDPGDGTAFGVIPVPPPSLTPLDAPPFDQGIQLATYTGTPQPSAAASGGASAPWWTSGDHSRVPPITQFDGGPEQRANCLLASGAMLARLAFGIVTTGSQLRRLQSRPTGGTTLGNLNEAVSRGWGITFAMAAVTPLQFRALSYAGAGAVLIGDYAQIPVAMRLQKDFTGDHAIYVDGFRPPSSGNPAAYYVDDPIGAPWAGYRGGWWPADIVEQFAKSFGSGNMVTAWAFAGGTTPPAHFPVLPPDAYPSSSGGPEPSSSPGASPEASPSASPSPSPVPLPSPGDTVAAPPAGDDGPVIPVEVSGLTRVIAGFGDASIIVQLGLCLGVPVPPYCPPGVPVQFPIGGLHGPLPAKPPPPIDLLYANVPQPGVVQVIFQATGGQASFDYWPTDGSGPVQHATSVEGATLGGKPVWLATFPVQAGGAYEFAAGMTGIGVAGISKIGSITLGP